MIFKVSAKFLFQGLDQVRVHWQKLFSPLYQLKYNVESFEY